MTSWMPCEICIHANAANFLVHVVTVGLLHCRLARDAEAAALAKEEEANRLAPLHEQHMRGLAPLQDEHDGAQR